MRARRQREREQARQARRSLASCCCFVVAVGWAYACYRVLQPAAAPPPAFFPDDDGAEAWAPPPPKPLRRPRLRVGAAARPAAKRVAFLFLVRSAIPTEPIWRAFFAGAPRDRYGIYSHPRPGYAFAAGSLFAGTEVANRSSVSWGAVTVARAELVLVRAALADARNARFLLASEACAPLHPFACVYDFLVARPASGTARARGRRERRRSRRSRPRSPSSRRGARPTARSSTTSARATRP